jgi:hypothetical protein
MSRLSRGLSARIDDLAAPRRLCRSDPDPTIPTHFRPGVPRDNLRTITGVKDMVAHPLRECHMVADKVRIIPPGHKPSGLCFFGCIKEANGEISQLVGGRSRPNLPGRDRITAEQKVFPPTLNIKRMSHDPLHHSMSPGNVPRWSVTKHSQLSGFENSGEVWFDPPTDGGLTHSAGACDKKEHGCAMQRDEIDSFAWADTLSEI